MQCMLTLLHRQEMNGMLRFKIEKPPIILTDPSPTARIGNQWPKRHCNMLTDVRCSDQVQKRPCPFGGVTERSHSQNRVSWPAGPGPATGQQRPQLDCRTGLLPAAAAARPGARICSSCFSRRPGCFGVSALCSSAVCSPWQHSKFVCATESLPGSIQHQGLWLPGGLPVF